MEASSGVKDLKYIISTLLLILLIGCSGSSKIPQEKLFLKSYLENKGYQVTSYEGRAQSYELTQEKIVTLPYMMYWGLQTVDPSPYFGENINVEKFIVTNHPLTKEKVEVFVYEAGGKPIGGTSYPHGNISFDGGYWSIDGKTLEEIQLKSFQAWREDWVNKYK